MPNANIKLFWCIRDDKKGMPHYLAFATTSNDIIANNRRQHSCYYEKSKHECVFCIACLQCHFHMALLVKEHWNMSSKGIPRFF